MADEGAPIEPKKYQTYQLNVDPDQDDKATEIKLCNFSRPHMRAFHCSWWSFFIAFFIWFSIAPLLSEIKITLKLTKQEIWTANIVSVAGTILMRFILGPGCDKYGARILFTIVLCTASIPTAMTGLINSATSLAVLRLFIGIAGGTFVMCQYWSSRMFTKQVVGTANALVGGWGNLGGGVTQIVMGTVLFPLFKTGMSAEQAWRTVCIVPAVVAFASGIIVYFISDDAPKGNYSDLKKNGLMPEVSAAASFRSGAMNINTWVLFVQYACCFGVELTMNNAAALYFRQKFLLSTEAAAAIASIFGWMNLFARGLGGFCSDKLNARMGMRGRIIAQTMLLLLEGGMVFIFANSDNLAGAIVCMVFFSVFVQAAEGSTYGIVPYVNPPCTGSIAGIVGAGGNTGAVCFGLGFRQLPEYKDAFIVMASCILASGILSVFINIKGHRGLICGEDAPEQKAQTLAVPLPEGEDEDVEASD
uniref:Nitrate/nitrite transporter n=1 Tax=Odontella aurita TaxID=265563 RepID=A0A7S4NA57_9STRA|mmetsp:Transcript_53972/g.161530  ORF Transcript_53972/g.161530 Transcript_53972/m.161530 type:complete len:475 (+) Transcript_53972:245-1669(+)|eukprot:CAMPEP_0113537846 /NCGR_PEP_ID=MMETSP0015_2-20120614/7050_1 /TAXON_ID=2838 /ORGANISM="Odontella" /LENGTH=474 /DNA_ID=CAMNT_0000437381 /DNA_START=196 /DNA_END=1620 /DNA_ORIENTATION=+ /assembly_acc=CAM_ASM_000160